MSSFRKPTPVLRKPPGEYGADGYYVDGTPETLSIRMSGQPLRLNEMDALPEGRRSSRSMKFYADNELYAAEQAESEEKPGRIADIITWDGRQWEVVACAPHQGGVIPHYKALAVEVKAN